MRKFIFYLILAIAAFGLMMNLDEFLFSIGFFASKVIPTTNKTFLIVSKIHVKNQYLPAISRLLLARILKKKELDR